MVFMVKAQVGTNTQVSANRATLDFSLPSQTVTVTPSTASVRVGGTVNFVASGGQNGYNWTATNGGSLAYTGANAGFSAATAATYIIQVWSPSGNGYAESNYATATITVGAPEKVKIKLPANTSGKPIDYIFMISGTTIGTETQNIGAAERTVEVTVPPQYPEGSQVQVWFKVLGIVEDATNGTWSKLEGAVVQKQLTTATATTTPATTTVTAPNVPKTNDDNTGKEVWSSAATDTALTDKAYKEGVDKTNTSLDRLNKILDERLAKGTTGTVENNESVDTGTHDRLDAANEKLDRIANALAPEDGGTSAVSDGESHAASRDTYDGKGGAKPSGTVTASGITTAPSGIIATQHIGSQDVSLTWTPTTWASGDAVMVASRTVLLWAMVLWTIYLLGSDARNLSASLSIVPQADSVAGIENAIPLVGQGKTWTAAALITAALIACAVAIVAVIDVLANRYGYGISALFSALNLSVFGGVIGIVDRYVPILAMCQLAIFRWGSPYIVTPIYLTAASLIKFLKA